MLPRGLVLDRRASPAGSEENSYRRGQRDALCGAQQVLRPVRSPVRRTGSSAEKFMKNKNESAWAWMLVLVGISLAGCLPSYDLEQSQADAGHDAPAEAGAIAQEGQGCDPPNALACAGHAQKVVLFCSPETGLWTALQTCTGQTLCDSRPGATQGTCQEPVAQCIGQAPGASVCDGTTLIECGPDLVTSEQVQCDAVCVDGACAGACEPGSRGCSGKVPQACDGQGKWQSEAPCAYVCTGAGQCEGECEPGERQCQGNVPQTCNASGQWESGAACANVCSSGNCVSACTEGEEQCNGSAPQTCVSGEWQAGESCPYVCAAGECTGQCVPNDKQCSGQVPQTCDGAGQWQSGGACSYACDAGQCVGVCVAGETETQSCGNCGHKSRSCQGGQWTAWSGCTGEGVCAPSATQACGDVGTQTCTSSCTWGSCVCSKASETEPCDCGGGTRTRSCTNGVWGSWSACADGCGALEECYAGQMCIAKSVSVTGGYTIDATEVTRSQYASWLSTNPSTSGQPSDCSWNSSYTPSCEWPASTKGNHPVVCVDWCDAYAYCGAAGKRLCGRIGGGPIPWDQVANASLSQWYRACSSNGQNDYPYGDSYSGTACNGNDASYGTTVEVASMSNCQSAVSGYQGVYDMSGNAREWLDCCNGLAGTEGSCRTRGGSFESDEGQILSCSGYGSNDSGRVVQLPTIGFRCCSSP